MTKLFRVGYYKPIPYKKSKLYEYSKPKRTDSEVEIPYDLFNIIINPNCTHPLNIYDESDLSKPPTMVFVVNRKPMPAIMENCKLRVNDIIMNYNNLVVNGKTHAEIIDYIFKLAILHEMIHRVYKDNGSVYLTVTNIKNHTT